MRKRRDQILDEATRLFAERGYDGTSMSDLAASVGLRKASLFHHFASKEELKSAVLDRLVREVVHVTQHDHGPQPLGQQLERGLHPGPLVGGDASELWVAVRMLVDGDVNVAIVVAAVAELGVAVTDTARQRGGRAVGDDAVHPGAEPGVAAEAA